MRTSSALIQSAILTLTFSGCAEIDRVQISSNPQVRATPAAAARFAVLDFDGEASQACADLLSMQLMRLGKDVAERQGIRAIRGELNDHSQNLTEDERNRRMGELARVDVVIKGVITSYTPPDIFVGKGDDQVAFKGPSITIDARALDVKTGEVFYSTNVTVSVSGGDGKYVNANDQINWACSEIVEGMLNPNYRPINRVLEGAAIAAVRDQRASMIPIRVLKATPLSVTAAHEEPR